MIRAKRMTDIQPFRVMDILAKAKALEMQGQSIIHMEVGEPDFSTPQPIIDAGKAALNSGLTHYTAAVGLPELRLSIAKFYLQRYRVDVDPARIVITPGASGALLLVMATLIEPGTQVLMADPGYPCNRHFVRLMEGKAITIPVDASTNYQLTAELVEKYWTQDTVAVLLASPSNPTGSLIAETELNNISQYVTKQNGVVLVDEIYQGLVYDSVVPTAVCLADNIFVINSFSKYFNMTGWRLGWVVAPLEYINDLDKLAQNVFLAAPTLSQHAALAAFEDQSIEILEHRKSIFKQRRDFLLPALRHLGFEVASSPQGAFYIYAKCERFSQDSAKFCNDLLNQAGVAITPGYDFGQYQANLHVRFAYTTSQQNLEEGLNRIEAYLKKLT